MEVKSSRGIYYYFKFMNKEAAIIKAVKNKSRMYVLSSSHTLTNNYFEYKNGGFTVSGIYEELVMMPNSVCYVEAIMPKFKNLDFVKTTVSKVNGFGPGLIKENIYAKVSRVDFDKVGSKFVYSLIDGDGKKHVVNECDIFPA